MHNLFATACVRLWFIVQKYPPKKMSEQYVWVKIYSKVIPELLNNFVHKTIDVKIGKITNKKMEFSSNKAW